MRARFNDSGITFLEVAVALGLILTFVLTTVPVFSSVMESYNLRGATHEIFGELQKSRLAAVMQNTPYRFYVVSGSGTYRIHDDLDGDYMEDSGEVTTKNVQKQNHGILLNSSDVITFLPNGTVVENGAITLVGGNGSAKSIQVGAGGSIRIQ